MEAHAGSGLKNIHNKRLVPLAVNHLFRGFHDAVSALIIDQPKLLVSPSRSVFHHANGTNKRGMGPHTGDGIVLHGARGLDAVINVSGNFFDTDGVLFLAKTVAVGRCRHEILLRTKPFIIAASNQLLAFGLWLLAGSPLLAGSCSHQHQPFSPSACRRLPSAPGL